MQCKLDIRDYKEGLKGAIYVIFLGNRIRFKKEMKKGLNYCTHPQTVHPTQHIPKESTPFNS